MKDLVFDKLQRLPIIWVSLSFIGLVVGLTSPEFRGESLKPWEFILLICSLSLFSGITELGSGYSRILLALPFTVRQLSRFLWFMAVGLPTVIMAGFCGLGILIRLPGLSSTSGLLVLWFQIILMSGLVSGSIFWIFSGSPLPRIRKTGTESPALGDYGIIFFVAVCAIVYWLNKAHYSIEATYFAVGIPGLIFTVLGWQRTESLLVEYGECRQTSLAGEKCIGTSAPPQGFGGILFLIYSTVGRVFGKVLLFLIIVAAVALWSGRGKGSNHSDALWFMPLAFNMSIAMQEATNILLHLKYLRSLPLTSKQIACMFLLITVSPYLVFITILAAVTIPIQNVPAAFGVLTTGILGLGPVCVLTTVIVWREEKRLGHKLMIIAAFVISGIAPACQLASAGTVLPIPLIVAYPIVFLMAALFVISHLIESNDVTYRMRLQDVKEFNQTNWS